MVFVCLSLFGNGQQPPEWSESYSKPVDGAQDKETALSSEKHITDSDEALDHDISGQSFGIEYISTKGEKTERWISVIRPIYRGNNISLMAYCFVRERLRQFRLDRITTVYDADGMITDSAEFFANFDLAYKSTPLPLRKPGAFIIKKMKDEARLLVAIARCDGQFNAKELDEILIYAVKKVENMGEFQSDEDITGFEKYLRNLYPKSDVLDGCLKRLKKYTDRGKKEFLNMCVRVMDADNIQDQSEFDLILEFKNELYF